MWNHLFREHNLKIHFAHRTFPWASEARGRAHVHVIIVGFAAFDAALKRIYDYDGGMPVVTVVNNISPYLTEGSDFAIVNRSLPLCAVPELAIGNKPIDGGNYLFSSEEKRAFILQEPNSERLFRRWIGADEYINGTERWCLWLGDCTPAELRTMPTVMERIERVRNYRLASQSPSTRRLAETPTKFHVENIPARNYLVIPEVSSERRNYIPIGFLGTDVLCSNKLRILPNAAPYHFGVLSSGMHMAWVRQVTGRMKSDFQYSVKLVFNNFPWPTPTEDQRARVEEKAQAVLNARAAHLPPRSVGTLADLYDPNTMPPDLHRAHADLDRAVERCYRIERFTSDRERVEFLFRLYGRMAEPLLPGRARVRGRRQA